MAAAEMWNQTEAQDRPSSGPSLWRRLRRSPVGMTGAVIVAIVLLVAAFAPQLAPYDPNLKNPAIRLKPPAWVEGGDPAHLLGTDTLGRDILSRIIYGSRVSVSVGVAAVLVAGAIGVVLGLVSGFAGRWVDTVLMRFTDAFLAIPSLLLTMLVVGIVGPGVGTLILVLGVTRWTSYARVVRGETLSVRERDFVQAAEATGVPRWLILFRHVLPNVAGSVIVLATTNVASVILTESSLSFLGIGVPPDVPTWGAMLSEGRNYIASAWWLATLPGLAISITVLGIIFLGDWLRDVLDPRLRR
ncbi:MAG: ABC transporter permease [Symbiobacterium sp.]|uniref:ABC transporter permease n=1 Tax=Symbiobacterium sp. TaxID=1971213 RepID=UPI003463D559